MRLMATLIALALVVLVAAPAAAAEPTTRYLALGDSLAVGDGASDPATTGYVPRMADYFAGAAHGNAKGTVNLAVGGETTASFLAGQIGAAVATILDPATDVAVVTLSIGGNDLLNLLNEPTDPCVQDPNSGTCMGLLFGALSGVATNYPNMLGMLSWALDQDPGAEAVYVLTVYNSFGGTGSTFEAPVDLALLGADGRIDCAAAQASPMNAGLDDIIACTTAFFGMIVVDGYGAIADSALELTHIGDPGFNIHPNDDGYAAIAKAHRLAARGA